MASLGHNELTSIGSDNGLPVVQCQAIIRTNTGLWSIRTWKIYFNEISFPNQKFSFKKMHLKMLSAIWDILFWFKFIQSFQYRGYENSLVIKGTRVPVVWVFPWKFWMKFYIKVIFKLNSFIDGWAISCEIALRGMSWDLTDDTSTLVQVMAWCCLATSHYLIQCWASAMPLYGITRPQWVKDECIQQYVGF